MALRFSLHVTVDGTTSGATRAALRYLLQMARIEGSGIILEEQRAWTRAEDVVNFMATYLPAGTPDLKIRRAGREFYQQLLQWSHKRVPLRFTCSLCNKARGDCRCKSLGRKPYGYWHYNESAYNFWLLETPSLLELTDSQIASLPATTAAKLSALRTYLMNRPG